MASRAGQGHAPAGAGVPAGASGTSVTPRPAGAPSNGAATDGQGTHRVCTAQGYSFERPMRKANENPVTRVCTRPPARDRPDGRCVHGGGSAHRRGDVPANDHRPRPLIRGQERVAVSWGESSRLRVRGPWPVQDVTREPALPVHLTPCGRAHRERGHTPCEGPNAPAASLPFADRNFTFPLLFLSDESATRKGHCGQSSSRSRHPAIHPSHWPHGLRGRWPMGLG
jgi:hypothetical protein